MEELTKSILEGAAQVIVLFYSDTCNKCHFWETELKKIENPSIPMWKYNAGNDPETCKRYELTNVPVLALIEDWIMVKYLDEITPNDKVIEFFSL